MLHLWLGKKVTDPELIFLPSLFEGFCKSEWFDDADIQEADGHEPVCKECMQKALKNQK